MTCYHPSLRIASLPQTNFEREARAGSHSRELGCSRYLACTENHISACANQPQGLDKALLDVLQEEQCKTLFDISCVSGAAMQPQVRCGCKVGAPTRGAW